MLTFRPKNLCRGPLNINEINEIEIRVIKVIQTSCFSRKIQILTDRQSIYKDKLAPLNLFVDENDQIRVGERLKKSKLAFSQKSNINAE